MRTATHFTVASRIQILVVPRRRWKDNIKMTHKETDQEREQLVRQQQSVVCL
jgi:hypothetical protein